MRNIYPSIKITSRTAKFGRNRIFCGNACTLESTREAQDFRLWSLVPTASRRNASPSVPLAAKGPGYRGVVATYATGEGFAVVFERGKADGRKASGEDRDCHRRRLGWARLEQWKGRRHSLRARRCKRLLRRHQRCRNGTASSIAGKSPRMPSAVS